MTLFFSLYLIFATLFTNVTALAFHRRYSSVKIQSYRSSLCLSPKGSPLAWTNGVQVTTVECNTAVEWDINPGAGSIIVSGTDLALDAGSGDNNSLAVKIWQSYPSLFQQTWYLTNDDRIAIAGGTQCLDEGVNGPQTYVCTTGNTNQSEPHHDRLYRCLFCPDESTGRCFSMENHSFYTRRPRSVPAIPVGTIYPDPSAELGRRIHPYGRQDLCVMLGNGIAVAQQLVDIAYCVANNSPYASLQLWNITLNVPSLISLQSHPNLCLNAGQTTKNGTRLVTSRCDTLNSRQKWLWDGTTLYLDSPTPKEAWRLCLDVEYNSTRTPQRPYDRLERLQMWGCVEGSHQQIFSVTGDHPTDDCD
ncbi:uncharacterized protein IL334_000015 [Kwoniella shivajii]|uniref:Ricin B lectin domain-containing protein n=1 Tax=Kwoniella shivajii TaxID=564305 RepID=A0ABZ1CMZ5_9TREE|nr:hypothetical protein IL334_000015 [Kwoniella shivajii]